MEILQIIPSIIWLIDLAYMIFSLGLICEMNVQTVIGKEDNE